jgi:hypothetical protein
MELEDNQTVDSSSMDYDSAVDSIDICLTTWGLPEIIPILKSK